MVARFLVLMMVLLIMQIILGCYGVLTVKYFRRFRRIIVP